MRKPLSCVRIFVPFLILLAFVFSANAQSCKLIEAIKSKDSLLIEKLIADPATGLKCADINNATALMWAIYRYNNSGNHFAKMLIKMGIDPKLKGIIYLDSLKQSYVGSPLAAAAKTGNLAMVKFLIDSCGIEVNEREFSTQGNAWTALFYAVQSFHVDITDYLLSKKCNVNLKDQYGYTPLMYVVSTGYTEQADKLIAAGAKVNDTTTLNGTTWTPLLLAAYYKQAGVLYSLIKNKADTTIRLNSGENAITLARTPTANYGVSIYHGCARDNCPELAEMLYKKGDKLNEEAVFAGGVKYTPLRLAFYNQSVKYAEWLLQHGVDTTGNLIEIKASKKNSLNNNTMIIQATDSNYIKVAEILIKNLNFDLLTGADLIKIFESKYLKNIYLNTYKNEADTKSTYYSLSWYGKAKPLLNEVLSNCNQINFIIEESYNKSITPLIYSIKNFQNDMFDKLLEKGADINFCNKSGETPLMYSVLCNNTYAFNKLIKFKSLKLDLADNTNQTALTMAVLSHDEEKVKVLILAGAELNSQDMDGNTPLLLALISGQKNIVRLLLKAGSEKLQQNNNHETLYSLLDIPKESPDNVVISSLNNELQYTFPINISVQTGFGSSDFLKRSNDGRMFMPGFNPIKVFDTESGKELLQLRMANIKYCDFTNDNKNIIVLDGRDAFFYLYSISSRSLISKIYLNFEPKDLYQVTSENFLIQYDSTVCLYSIKERKKLLDVPADRFYYFNNYLYCFTKKDSLLSKYKLLEGSAPLVSTWEIPINHPWTWGTDLNLYVSNQKAFLFTSWQFITLNFESGAVSDSIPFYPSYTPYSNYIAYHDSAKICSIRNLDDNSVFKSPFPQLVREIIPLDNNRLLITTDDAINLYNTDTRETNLLVNKNYQDNVCNYTFNPDGTVCTYATTAGIVKNWSLIKSSFDTKLYGSGLSCKRSCYDRTGQYIIYFGSSWGGSSDTYLYSCVKNAIIDTIHESYTNVGFSADNTKLFLDTETYSFPELKQINNLNKSSLRLNVININSNWIAHASDIGVNFSNNKCSIYDLINHKQVISLPRKFGSAFSCNFSSDDKSLVCSDYDSVFLFNISTGSFEKSIYIPTLINSVDISQDGKYIAAGGFDNIVYVIERSSGNISYRLRGHTGMINTVWFSHDGRYLMSGAQDVTIRLWDWVNGKELATLYALNSEDWAVITPDKLFDASDGAMDLINYSVGTDVMQLNQIKNRFYEPGLLSKVLGYNSEPIRKVQGTGNIKIFPKVTANINPGTGKLAVALTNQGGGIGKLKIFVNGKEIADDSRSPGASSDALKDTTFINLAGHPYLVPGKNTIEVKAMNAEGYLISRGVSLLYSEEVKEDYHPNIYILTCGVSDYNGDKLDLKYASKDAEDMAFAFNIAAGKLFGKKNTFVYSLNTSIKNDSLWPNKKNIISTINKIAAKIKSTDVFVLYLSGHGINYGGQEGDFYYLTADAYSAADEVLKDNDLRKQFTLSSQELTQLLQSIAAHKQVLLIDACASGRLVENLMTKRDVSSSSIRALDRMKDRTGVHIITGCAADAVSYEATRYGQGILTYSLLEGIKGSALREDKYVDVVQLFQKARERVPELAKGIGGIQIPQVISPYGAQSFDIGLMEPADKVLIPLAKEKPIIVRSNFQDADQLEDILQLSEKMDNLMNEVSMKGKEANMLFMDIRDFPESIKLTGLYSQVDGKVVLKLKIKSPVGEKLFQLESSNASDLLQQIYTTVSQAIK